MITIQINKLKYDVSMAGAYDSVFKTNGEVAAGVTFNAAGQIYIDETLYPAVMRRTIMHEITHAYLYAYGYLARAEFSQEDLCEFISSFADAIIYDTDAVMKHYGKEQ